MIEKAKEKYGVFKRWEEFPFGEIVEKGNKESLFDYMKRLAEGKYKNNKVRKKL